MALSGGFFLRRRSAQYPRKSGSSGDARKLTATCRSIFVQANRGTKAPVVRSPKINRSLLDVANLPKYWPTTQRFGLFGWERVAHL